MRRNNDSIILLNFEEIIKDPKVTLKKLCYKFNIEYNENLNIPGVKSINLPLGEVKITRKVKSLTIIFRSCTNVHMLTQNKKRLFDKKKSEYTFRSLNSIIRSLQKSKNIFPKVGLNIIVIDHNSKFEDLKQIQKQLIQEKDNLTAELNDVEKKILLLSENIDLDYLEILYREKFFYGKANEKVYLNR